MDDAQASHALIQSLIDCPLFIGNLPQSPCFDRSLFETPREPLTLNFDQKLGHLYEDAMRTLIIASPKLDLIADHIQINRKNKTLGELDFVMFDKVANKHIHLELAVKFYMAIEHTNGWIFPGPNRTDNWHNKLAKLQTHQLRLTHAPETQHHLKERYTIEEIENRHLIYGRLFTPYNTQKQPDMPFMHKNAHCGQWLSLSAWQKTESYAHNTPLYHIPKPLWPIALSAENRTLLKPISHTDIAEKAKEHCIMILPKHSTTPLFITPDHWQ